MDLDFNPSMQSCSNLSQDMQVIYGREENLNPLSRHRQKSWSFADDIDQDQTAQSVQYDLDLCRPLIKSNIRVKILCGTPWIVFTVVKRGRF